MNCAFCANPLEAIEDAVIEIDRCDRCKSIWFDRGELERYAASRGHQPTGNSQIAPESDGLHLGCPRCRRETLYRARALGVTLWHCSDCKGVAVEQPSHLALLQGPAHASESRPIRSRDGDPALWSAGDLVEGLLDLLGFLDW